MPNDNYFKGTTLVLATLLVLMSCRYDSTEEKEPDSVISIPFFVGCESAVTNVQKVFERVSSKHAVTLSAKIIPFDAVPASHSEVRGYVVLTASAGWRTLSNKTSVEYLQLNASGIMADCMPNNATSIAIDNLEVIENAMRRIPTRGAIYPRVSEGELQLYFNDGSYSVPKL